ncbi:zinc finger protein 724-like isoform X1 [Schistocerca piceifrons]|uniref:zinc finger protein 724-like isoform X1 n=2 Tax=Schistocerca piceifrons TaxID=274613 RepID=UPI001F5F0C62|nr:zinc finger protein 724-like isoform X1 [Schistocerca piceifrons]
MFFRKVVNYVLQTCTVAAMDDMNTIWIKQEITDGVPSEPDPMVLEDPEGNSCPTDFIKEDPEPNLHVDETENIVLASMRCASDSVRLVHSMGESCGISFEETVHEGVIHDKLERGAEDTVPVYLRGTHTQGLTLQEDSSFSTRHNCSLSEIELHEFSCSFCLQIFPSKYRLIMHIFTHIDGVKPPIFVCRSCGEVFSSKSSLNKHLKGSGGDEALSAGNREIFDTCDEDENIILEDGKAVSVTEQTEKQFSHKGTLKTSKNSMKDICDTHSITHVAERQDKSDSYGTLCTADNASTDAAVVTVKRPHKCDICGKSFFELCNLKTHSLIHTGERPHRCDICGKSFIQLGHLNSHSLIHSGKKPHKCDICDKSFIELRYLKGHSLVHTGKRLYKCDICGKSFTRLHNLKRHELLHAGYRPHKCDICGKCFAQLDTLKSHTLMHSGERPHKCDICGKTFTELRWLKRHATIHSGKRPHKCKICGKSFTQLAHLKSHLLIHTGKRRKAYAT